MKTSELIARLAEMLEEHGDLVVCHSDDRVLENIESVRFQSIEESPSTVENLVVIE